MRADGSRHAYGVRMRRLGVVVGALIVGALVWPTRVHAQTPTPTAEASPERAPSSNTTIDAYMAEMETLGLIDVDTGTIETLRRELQAAETLLQSGASIDAAVALFGIVESPRYEGFGDFVEYQNAEYDLAVALAVSGAYESSLTYLMRTLRHGTDTLYFAPAHRRAVDIALETRDYRGVLDRLQRVTVDMALPTEASGERAYLKARAAYANGQLVQAEGELATVSRKSRLYSSSLYLRGVISTRQGQWQSAAEALCEIVDTPDDNKYTFVVDNRYFTIKDLARLGLGRIAHEQTEYDDAYYHYFQIPDDSDRLPEALFEAAWSMYQKRELATSRDLVSEFLTTFPNSPLAPEARLLAGYIELADCQFDAARNHYETLIAELEPVIKEIEQIAASPERVERLFDRALERWRKEREDPDNRIVRTGNDPNDKVLGLLRLDAKFVKLHDAIHGLRRSAGDAPHVVRAWTGLGKRVATSKVGAAAATATIEEEDAADANGLVDNIGRLRDQISRAEADLRRGKREKTLPDDAAEQESKRLRELARRVDALKNTAARLAAQREAEIVNTTAGGIGPMLRADLQRARQLSDRSQALLTQLSGTIDEMSMGAMHRLYSNVQKILNKAKLGKIDAVIGQKGKLDIEVQDLAAGRWPPELHGRLWEEGLIGDDEEYWPFEGEFWADEYKGWR